MTGWAQRDRLAQGRCSRVMLRSRTTLKQVAAIPFVSGDPLPKAAPKTGKADESDAHQHPSARLGDRGHGVADVGAHYDAVLARIGKGRSDK